MKKSFIYHLAQLAVLRDNSLSEIAKLVVLRELQEKQSLEAFVEEQEAAESETN